MLYKLHCLLLFINLTYFLLGILFRGDLAPPFLLPWTSVNVACIHVYYIIFYYMPSFRWRSVLQQPHFDYNQHTPGRVKHVVSLSWRAVLPQAFRFRQTKVVPASCTSWFHPMGGGSLACLGFIPPVGKLHPADFGLRRKHLQKLQILCGQAAPHRVFDFNKKVFRDFPNATYQSVTCKMISSDILRSQNLEDQIVKIVEPAVTCITWIVISPPPFLGARVGGWAEPHL